MQPNVAYPADTTAPAVERPSGADIQSRMDISGDASEAEFTISRLVNS